MRRYLVVSLLLLTASLLIVACGGGGARGPDLEVRAVISPYDANRGDEIEIRFTVHSAGTQPTAATGVIVYLSATAEGADGDTILYQGDVPAMAAGGSFPVQTNVTIPVGTAEAAWFLRVVSDPTRAAGQSNYANDTAARELLVYNPNAACTLERRVIAFADENLATRIRAVLDLPASHALTCADMHELEELRLNQAANVTSLAGLEHARNLVRIELYGTGVTDLGPLVGLPQLIDLMLDTVPANLNFDYSQLEDFPDLEILAVIYTNDQLTSLVFLDEMRGLRELNLRGNRALAGQYPVLSALHDLESLDLGYTDFHHNDLQWLWHMDQLVLLSLSDTEITNLMGLNNFPANSLPNLRWLDLTWNELESIAPLANLTQIEYLILRGANVNDYTPLANLTNLIYLDISENLSGVVTPLSSLQSLEQLILDNLGIGNLEPLNGLQSLWLLSLDWNPAMNLAELTNLPNLLYLSARNNGLDNANGLTGLPSLVGIDLSGNSISNLQPLALLPNLAYLIVESNRITSLQPLVDSPHFPAGLPPEFEGGELDGVLLVSDNCLDLGGASPVPGQIATLESRGVLVIAEEQRDPCEN